MSVGGDRQGLGEGNEASRQRGIQATRHPGNEATRQRGRCGRYVSGLDGRGGYRYIMHVHPDDYERALQVLDVDQNMRSLADFHLDLHRRFESKG